MAAKRFGAFVSQRWAQSAQTLARTCARSIAAATLALLLMPSMALAATTSGDASENAPLAPAADQATRMLVGRDDGVPAHSIHDENESETGRSPDENGSANDAPLAAQSGSELPRSYSSVANGYVTSVKDQQALGLCWAFGTIAAVESSLLAHGQASADTLDLSERHLSYFTYHAFDDPLEYMDGDQTQPTSNGQYGESLPDPSLTAGGNPLMATHALTTWRGAADETTAPYEELMEAYWQYDLNRYASDTTVDHSTLDEQFLESAAIDRNQAFNDAWHISGAYLVDLKDADDVKSALVEYGGAAITMFYDDDYCNYRQRGNDSGGADVDVTYAPAYYYYGGYNTNHIVTIVGWDDDYPAENFETDYAWAEDAGIEVSLIANKTKKPEHNGAWLVKNSYGSYWGEGGGYFWMSYDDTCVNGSSSKAHFFDVEPADDYDHLYAHDGSTGWDTRSVVSGGCIANEFVAKANPGSSESLDAVSFELDDVNVDYSIQVYTGITDPADPTSGTPALDEPVTGKTSFAGFYTVQLPEAVLLSEGERYAVAVTLSHAKGTGIRYAVDGNSSVSWAKFTSAVHMNQSFSWHPAITYAETNGLYIDDLARTQNVAFSTLNRGGNAKDWSGCVARIKAYTHDVSVSVEQTAFVYDGTPKTPAVQLAGADGILLAEGTDYTVSYENNVDAGTGTVTITRSGNFMGAIKKKFSIARAPLGEKATKLTSASYTYDGTAKKPGLVASGKAFAAGKDYTVAYAGNVNAGTATATFTGKGNYTGTVKKTFSIARAQLASGSSTTKASLAKTAYTYDGKAKTPGVTVVFRGRTLVRNIDYTVSYAANKAASSANRKATVTITGKGNYRGTVTRTFTIAKAANPVTIAKKTINAKYSQLAKANKAYTIGKAKKAQGKVTYSITKAVKGSKSFKSKFSINKSTGKVTVKKGTAKGTYKVTVKATAKGNANYKAGSKSAVITIKVK